MVQASDEWLIWDWSPSVNHWAKFSNKHSSWCGGSPDRSHLVPLSCFLINIAHGMVCHQMDPTWSTGLWFLINIAHGIRKQLSGTRWDRSGDPPHHELCLLEIIAQWTRWDPSGDTPYHELCLLENIAQWTRWDPSSDPPHHELCLLENSSVAPGGIDLVTHYTMSYVCSGSPDRSQMVHPLDYFTYNKLHNWYNKGCGMCYPIGRMVYVKDPLLLIEKNSQWSGSSRFPLSLSVIIYLTIYIWTISLNKTIIWFCQIWSIIVNSPVNTAGNISKNLIYWNLWGQRKC